MHTFRESGEYMAVIEIGSFYGELSFRHYFQHYSLTTRTSGIQVLSTCMSSSASQL